MSFPLLTPSGGLNAYALIVIASFIYVFDHYPAMPELPIAGHNISFKI
jgi:hypothetical protein